MPSGRRWRRVHGKHAELRFLLDHERNKITRIADDRTHQCPCFLARTCEKSILAAVGITQASLLPEVIKTFDHLLDLLIQKVTPHKWPVAMHAERESTPPHPIDEFCSLRCAVQVASHKQCTVAPQSTTRKTSGAHCQ